MEDVHGLIRQARHKSEELRRRKRLVLAREPNAAEAVISLSEIDSIAHLIVCLTSELEHATYQDAKDSVKEGVTQERQSFAKAISKQFREGYPI